MASFTTKTFQKHDSYMTPRYAWENIKQFVPKDKILWESFVGDGESGRIWTSMGYNVIQNPYPEYDFFKYEPDNYDIIVTNPPFSKTKQVMERMAKLDKPFIMIMPSSKINTQYFRKFAAKLAPHQLQIIVPRTRIHFKKLVNGKPPVGWKDRCNFDCFYYAYKMNLPNDMIWLDDNALKKNKPEWNEQALMAAEDININSL